MLYKLLVTILLGLIIGCSSEKKDEIHISVAISLKDSLDEITKIYKEKNPEVEFFINYGASGTLKKQLENGIKSDIVIMATPDEMDYLENLELIDTDSRKDFLQNSLILIGEYPLEELEEVKNYKIALGEPTIVPLGHHSKRFLEERGIYENLKNPIFSKDAKSVFNYAELGEVDYAVVYSTEKKNMKRTILIKELEYKLPTYSFSLTKEGREEYKEKFYNFLFSQESIEIHMKNGFKVE